CWGLRRMARFSASSSERLTRVVGSTPTPRVYLDYAGFSPVDPRVVAVMRPFLEGGVGNAGAQHSLGLEARSSLDGARAKVARLFGAVPAGVIFTASATEANNLAIKGLAQRAAGGHIVTSAIEHVSVMASCRDLEKRGWTVTYVGVDREGRLDPQAGTQARSENLPAIAGMGVAADLARADVTGEAARLAELRDRLLSGLLARVPEARLTGASGTGRLPHHVSIVVPGVKADGVLLELDLRGVAASSGAICTAMTGEPSHVLRAIGCDQETAEGSLCFTLGRWTTAGEIEIVLDTVPVVVARLRRLAPQS